MECCDGHGGGRRREANVAEPSRRRAAVRCSGDVGSGVVVAGLRSSKHVFEDLGKDAAGMPAEEEGRKEQNVCAEFVTQWESVLSLHFAANANNHGVGPFAGETR